LARSAHLAEMLRDARITAVFATEYQRTISTARPTATRLGLPVQSIAATDLPGLLTKIRAAGPKARLFIVGHSDTVPRILSALGYANELVIAKGEYDNLFVVIPRDMAGVAPTVLRLRY
jgi:hypothetical protein